MSLLAGTTAAAAAANSSAGGAGFGLGDLIWLFFIVSILQPILRQRWLDKARERLIKKIEQARGSRVIILIHRQETMALLGFPIMRYIDIEDSEQIVRALRLTDENIPIDIVLHTPGGLQLAATQIAHAIADRRAKTTVFVPHYAMSGGMLIAMAADEIVMDAHAVLGAVDPQIGQWPAVSILKAKEEKDVNALDDETLILADVARKAIMQMRADVKRLLSRRMAGKDADALADLMTRGDYTHDHPISCGQAKELGLPVRCEVPVEIYALMELFPQPARKGGVEFIPLPYRVPPAPPHSK